MKKIIHWETVADCSFDYWNNPDKVRKDDLIMVITHLINGEMTREDFLSDIDGWIAERKQDHKFYLDDDGLIKEETKQ